MPVFPSGGAGRLGPQKQPCLNYTVVFQEKVQSVPEGVYAGKQRIGSVEPPANPAAQGGELTVCIEANHAGKMERNSIFFLSDGKLHLYNVWSTGQDLAQGDRVVGFQSRTGLFLHEAGQLLDVLLAWLSSLLGGLLESLQDKTPPPATRT